MAWGDILKSKEKEAKAADQVFTAEVNGVKLTAPTQEALMAMIPTVQGIQPASALEPEPAPNAVAQPAQAQPAAQQPGQPQAGQVTKWTIEQFQQAIASGDIHGAIMGIVGQALGIADFPAHMGQMSRAIEGVYNFSHNNMIGSALAAAGAEPTAANIQKFTQLMSTRPQTEQQPTVENYSKFAEHVTAPERQWIAKAPVAAPVAQPAQIGPDGQPIQAPVSPVNAAPGAMVMPQPQVQPGAQVGVQPALAQPAATVAAAPLYATNVVGPQAVVEAQFPTRGAAATPLEGLLTGQTAEGGGDAETVATAEGLSLAELEQNLAEASVMPAPAQAG